MMRLIAFIVVLFFILATIAASDRAKPLVVDAHGSGHWLFNEADYTQCATVSPAPLVPHLSATNPYARRSDTA